MHFKTITENTIETHKQPCSGGEVCCDIPLDTTSYFLLQPDRINRWDRLLLLLSSLRCFHGYCDLLQINDPEVH